MDIMTDNQRDKLNRFLAEKVIGIVVGKIEVLNDRYPYGYRLDNADGTPYAYPGGGLHGWGYQHSEDAAWFYCPKFCTSWADCEPLLDKIERDGWKWDWDNFDDRYTFEVMKDCDNGPNENSLVFHASSKTRTEALCLAIARCYGWKV